VTHAARVRRGRIRVVDVVAARVARARVAAGRLLHLTLRARARARRVHHLVAVAAQAVPVADSRFITAACAARGVGAVGHAASLLGRAIALVVVEDLIRPGRARLARIRARRDLACAAALHAARHLARLGARAVRLAVAAVGAGHVVRARDAGDDGRGVVLRPPREARAVDAAVVVQASARQRHGHRGGDGGRVHHVVEGVPHALLRQVARRAAVDREEGLAAVVHLVEVREHVELLAAAVVVNEVLVAGVVRAVGHRGRRVPRHLHVKRVEDVDHVLRGLLRHTAPLDVVGHPAGDGAPSPVPPERHVHGQRAGVRLSLGHVVEEGHHVGLGARHALDRREVLVVDRDAVELLGRRVGAVLVPRHDHERVVLLREGRVARRQQRVHLDIHRRVMRLPQRRLQVRGRRRRATRGARRGARDDILDLGERNAADAALGGHVGADRRPQL